VLEPTHPAEEAVVHVAVTCGYTDVAFDLIGVDDDLRAALDALPVGSTQPEAPGQVPEADYTFDEVLPALTGDADIETLWDPGLDGLDDPQDPTNRFLGIGDYRPHRRHVTFGRYGDEPDLPSTLW
jgi:hypothetical protein